MLAPPVQTHSDVVVYEDVLEHLDEDTLHVQEHHQNDSEEEQNTEHHHHCSVLNITLTFLPTQIDINFIPVYTKKAAINFYQNSYYLSYLDGVFQPPKA